MINEHSSKEVVLAAVEQNGFFGISSPTGKDELVWLVKSPFFIMKMLFFPGIRAGRPKKDL